MKKIRFIHAADLHLDSPFQGLRDLPDKLFQNVRESTFEALQVLVDHAINYKVDFVILAGDLFDGENRSLRAQVKLKKAMDQLQQHGICCYIIHGNHDNLQGNWMPLSWPDNVFFFKDEVHPYQFIKDDITVHLYGFSYPEKTVKENIATQYHKVGEADIHIGILHGTAEGQEGHDHYAPFSVQQLIEKDFDYWALGHIHKRQILHKEPFVVYPGNFQGRHKKELGQKGAYLVELTNEKTATLTFLPTSKVNWEEVSVSIEGVQSVDELKSRCETALVEAKEDGTQLLAILRLTGSGPLHNYLIEEIDDFIDLLNFREEDNSTYIVNKKLETIGEWDREKMKNEQHLLSDIVTTVERLKCENDSIVKMLSEVYNNPKLKRYLISITEEEQMELLQEAESYLLTALLKERDE